MLASEEVTLQLVKSKCLPILLYVLECYSLFTAIGPTFICPLLFYGPCCLI